MKAQVRIVETMSEDIPISDDILIKEIKELIPHRYPMLLVDRIINVRLGESATGIKCVSINEDFFQGHFPDSPIMPGVLIVEALAQTAGALVMKTLGDEAKDKLIYFMSINEAKFRRPVVPGDRLELNVSKLHQRRTVWKFKGEAKVDGKVVSEATYTAMIVNKYS